VGFKPPYLAFFSKPYTSSLFAESHLTKNDCVIKELTSSLFLAREYRRLPT
jgi:hypothetical protein